MWDGAVCAGVVAGKKRPAIGVWVEGGWRRSSRSIDICRHLSQYNISVTRNTLAVGESRLPHYSSIHPPFPISKKKS